MSTDNNSLGNDVSGGAPGEGMSNPTPEQLARFADFARKLMAMTNEEFEIEGRVVEAIAKAEEKGSPPLDPKTAQELDLEVLAAIEEMKGDPESDQDIVKQMEENYRNSVMAP